jgi:hypothetical protein
MKLVQEGKLSPEDAADLIDAFVSEGGEEAVGERQTPPPPPGSEQARDEDARDPFKSFVDAMEKVGRDVSESVNWGEIAGQVRTGTRKGLDSLKVAVEQIKKGEFQWGFLGNEERKDVELPLAVPEGKKLRIENPCGNVKVLGGFDLGLVTARARIRGATPEDAKQKADAYTLIIEESDHEVLIRQPDTGALSVDLEVQLSSQSPVEVRVMSGDASVLDTNASSRVTSMSGNVHLRAVGGTVEVTATSGDVKIEQTEAVAVSVENKSGDIRLDTVKGNLTARTASGDVKVIRGAGKTTSIESVSGDVHVDLSEPVRGSVNIRTVNGSSCVCIADGSDGRVSLSTLRGTVNCEIDLEDDASDDQRVTGRLGDGTGTIDVSAVTGDVTLCLRDHTECE